MIALVDRLPPDAALVTIVASATAAKLMAVVVMAAVPPAPDAAGLGKDIGGTVGVRQLMLAFALAAPVILAFAYLRPLAALATLLALLLFLWWFRRLLLRRLGGSTGDCLGFAAYVGQLVLLLAAAWH